eukprot:TRINITY_DN3725_c0_g10_i1.p1 TRINITY_DN3725_c0_g10~~TRINITY_DN3725_c0_g10_i1.p1  ORF type:complete len:263 (+),score=101.75 TRINITY_DN3725_c0_g10_i1:225-1013(+)
MSRALTVLVQPPCERPFQLTLSRDATVNALMDKIQDTAGIPSSEQSLVCGGRQLAGGASIVDQRIGDEAVVHLRYRLCGGAPKKKKKKKKGGDDGGAGELTPEEVQEIAKLRIQFLERELMLKKEEATEAIHAKNELRERVKEFHDEFEREKLRTLDITADMTRQYKAMQERFILEINKLNNNIVDLQDQLKMAERKLEQHMEDAKQQMNDKDQIIQEQRQKMEEMATEFGKMLEDTLKKMTDRIEVSSKTYDVDESEAGES